MAFSSDLRNHPSRRDLLAALLGVPAALAGCSGETPPLPDGEIIGPSVELGHRLRKSPPPAPPPDRWKTTRVVIVGGGVTGLAAGWRLLNAGFKDFVLLELEKEPGGTARSGISSITAYPWGAHYVPAPLAENALLIEVLREIGVVEGTDAEGQPRIAEQYLCRDPQERIFFKGRWYEGLYPHLGETEQDRAEWHAFQMEVRRWVGWRDGRGRRAFAIPVATGSDDATVTALDKLSIAEWLDRRGFRSSRLQWLVNYACRDDYGSTLEDTSAWAGLFYFASRISKPGAEPRPFITWPEGNGRLVNHFYARLRNHVQLGFAAADIVPTDPNGRRGVDVVALNAANRAVVGYHADYVIFAAPQFLARYLIRPYRDDPPVHLGEFQYATWMVANLTLKDRPPESSFPLAWDNVIYESPSLGYVVATHQTERDRGPTVLTYYYPFCEANPNAARKRLLGLNWSECAEIALTDLARAHPSIRSLVERIDVMRWGHGMVQPRPRFMWGSARMAAARPFRGIFFGNSDLSGVGLFEEALYRGVRAADDVLAAHNS